MCKLFVKVTQLFTKLYLIWYTCKQYIHVKAKCRLKQFLCQQLVNCQYKKTKVSRATSGVVRALWRKILYDNFNSVWGK